VNPHSATDVTIDEYLMWEGSFPKHSMYCQMGLTNLRRFNTYISRDTRKALYRALFLPHLDHYCVLWLACGTKLGKNLNSFRTTP